MATVYTLTLKTKGSKLMLVKAQKFANATTSANADSISHKGMRKLSQSAVLKLIEKYLDDTLL